VLPTATAQEASFYSAPDLQSVTRRREWSPNSPVFDQELAANLPVDQLDYQSRIKTPSVSEDVEE
jgi:hypothetical protein